MRLVDYPGEVLPPPRFRIGVPEGWVAHPAPGLLAVVEPAERIGPFQPNVVVVADVVPAGLHPAKVLDVLVAEATRPPARAVALARAETGPVPGGGAPAGLGQRLVRQTEVGTVNQVATAFVTTAPIAGNLVYAYTVTASWLLDEHDVLLRRVHESFAPVPADAVVAGRQR
jgi:hypothetical protein